uniref:Tick transposon n=1 Tax=Rhipicephalus appendiculatus TaxID=34631 RepID=A0A131Z120_RHIAP
MMWAVKELFRKSTDWPLALLSYCNAPGMTGYSPAQLFMGRNLRTCLLGPVAMLLPGSPMLPTPTGAALPIDIASVKSLTVGMLCRVCVPWGRGKESGLAAQNMLAQFLVQRSVHAPVVQTDAGTFVCN